MAKKKKKERKYQIIKLWYSQYLWLLHTLRHTGTHTAYSICASDCDAAGTNSNICYLFFEVHTTFLSKEEKPK